MTNKQTELFDKLYDLEMQMERVSRFSDEYDELRLERDETQDELDELNGAECKESKEHMRMTVVNARKGDVCFNCGTV